MTRFPWKSGDAIAICDRCGFRFYLSELQKTWDGFMVDKACFEERHPQDYLRGVPERISVKDPRPEGPDTFIEVDNPLD